jgi:hypothetical protein
MDASVIIPTNAWTRARDRFLEDLSDEERATFADASLENLFYSASARQKTHQAESRSLKLVSKLEPITSAIEQYGKALDIYSNAAPLILCPLWGSIRVVIQVTSLAHL